MTQLVTRASYYTVSDMYADGTSFRSYSLLSPGFLLEPRAVVAAGGPNQSYSLTAQVILVTVSELLHSGHPTAG